MGGNKGNQQNAKFEVSDDIKIMLLKNYNANIS